MLRSLSAPGPFPKLSWRVIIVSPLYLKWEIYPNLVFSCDHWKDFQGVQKLYDMLPPRFCMSQRNYFNPLQRVPFWDCRRQSAHGSVVSRAFCVPIGVHASKRSCFLVEWNQRWTSLGSFFKITVSNKRRQEILRCLWNKGRIAQGCPEFLFSFFPPITFIIFEMPDCLGLSIPNGLPCFLITGPRRHALWTRGHEFGLCQSPPPHDWTLCGDISAKCLVAAWWLRTWPRS